MTLDRALLLFGCLWLFLMASAYAGCVLWLYFNDPAFGSSYPVNQDPTKLMKIFTGASVWTTWLFVFVVASPAIAALTWRHRRLSQRPN